MLFRSKAYYNFQQTSGNLTNIATTANGFPDGLGSSGDLTTGGTITKSAGDWNFASTDGYAIETTTPAISGTFSALTLNCWLKPASTRDSYVFVLTANDGNTNNFFSIQTTVAGKIQVTGGDNLVIKATTSSTSYSTSSIQMATLVYDGYQSGTGRLKLYFNGINEGTANGTNSASYTLTLYPSVAKQGNSGQPFFTGDLYDCSVWNRALSEIGRAHV